MLKVAIIGGGIGGLTVAQELIERGGFQIDVYEGTDTLGGKAKSHINPDGYPGEHSVRIVSHTYYHLLNTLRRIPTTNGQTVFDNVRPTLAGSRKYLMFRDYDPCILPNYFPYTYSGFKEYFKFYLAMRKIVPDREIFSFIYKLAKSAAMSSERRYAELGNITWDEYLDSKNKSPAYKHYLHRLPEYYVAARGDSSAKSMSILVEKSLFVSLIHPIDSAKSSHNMFNGPTSEVFIDPWEKYLRSLGVNFHFNKHVTKINVNDKRVTSFITMEDKQEELHTADIYVFCVPVEVMRKIVDVTPEIKKMAPSLANLHKLKVEASSGIQFYFTNDDIDMFPKGWTAFLDSPWAFVGICQSKKTWPDRTLKPPVKGILSFAWSNFDEPGILYNKPARECTESELKEETIAQLSAHRGADYMKKMKVHSCHIDPELKFDPITHKVVRHNAPLFLQMPGCFQYQPGAETAIDNLYIAADYCRTTYDITTMEAANEAGRLAAAAILKKYSKNTKPIFLMKESRTGFGFFQFFDRLFYKMFHRTPSNQ